MKRLTIGDYIVYIICSVIALLMVLPFYSVVIQSVATPASIAKQQLYILPTSFDLSSYKAIIDGGKFTSAFVISMIVAIAGTALSIILSICGGYVLAKKRLPGRKWLMAFVLFTMFFNGGLIPYYMNIKSLGLINNIAVMFVPNAINTFYMIIMMNYFRSIPASLEESAKIDGASYLTTLIKIIIPISKPTIAAITLFYAVDRWNEWWSAMLFIVDPKKYPMQLYLRELLIDVNNMASNNMAQAMISTLKETTAEGIKMAAVVVTVLPIMLVYPFLQKHFAAGVMVGSIKE